MAVKRMSVADTEPDAIKRVVEEHDRLNHVNVLKLLHVDEEKDPNFKYDIHTVIIYISMELNNIELLVADVELKVPGA